MQRLFVNVLLVVVLWSRDSRSAGEKSQESTLLHKDYLAHRILVDPPHNVPFHLNAGVDSKESSQVWETDNWAECLGFVAECREYAKLVYAKEVAPVLRMGARSNTVSQCGIVETPLIIGGVKAKPNEFPHMAVIGYGGDLSQADVSWHCGGTVISENYILTAAHCMESRDKGPAIRVRAGLTNLRNPEDDMQERKVADRIKHPRYRAPSKYHDIALLRLDVPLDLNDKVRPACLQVEPTPPGGKAIASGFGKTTYGGRADGSNDLMKVQLDYIPEGECNDTFKSDIGGKQLPDGIIPNLLCAGAMEGGKDTCQGDSGGPLQRVLEDPYCTYSVVGVTSFGKFCGFKRSPAIYSRVSSYIDWIENLVWP